MVRTDSTSQPLARVAQDDDCPETAEKKRERGLGTSGSASTQCGASRVSDTACSLPQNNQKVYDLLLGYFARAGGLPLLRQAASHTSHRRWIQAPFACPPPQRYQRIGNTRTYLRKEPRISRALRSVSLHLNDTPHASASPQAHQGRAKMLQRHYPR